MWFVVLAAIGVQLWVAGLAVVPIWQAVALILTSPLFVTLGRRVSGSISPHKVLAVLLGAFGGVLLAPWADAFAGGAVAGGVRRRRFGLRHRLLLSGWRTEDNVDNALSVGSAGSMNRVATVGAGFFVVPCAVVEIYFVRVLIAAVSASAGLCGC
jgi:S-adenosylmethionine uptake transporter